MRRTLVVSLFLVLTCNVSLAQQAASADLMGVVSAAGRALPGVTVTVSSPSMQGTRSTVTSFGGGYVLRHLPIGVFQVAFELDGMERLVQTVTLAAAHQARVDATLQIGSIAESLTVNGDATPRNAASEIGTIAHRTLLEMLPATRTLRDITLLSSSANAFGVRNRLTIAGAPSWDSLFLVDGVVVNENLSGQPHNMFIADAIEEVTILSGAVSSEYGRFTGGVVTAVTKSGGNSFSASLRDTLTNASWTAKTPWRDEPSSPDHIDHLFEGTAGGYLLKDRLWFFAAARSSNVSAQRLTARTDIPYIGGTKERRAEVKVTATAGASHNFVGSYSDLNLRETNVVDTDGGRVADLDALIPLREQPTRLLALSYNGTLTRSLFAELQHSATHYSIRGDGGRSTDRISGTFINVRGERLVFNAPPRCGVCGDDARDSSSTIGKVTWYRPTVAGAHVLTAGVERFAERRIANGNRSASRYNIQTGGVRIVGDRVYPVFGRDTVIGFTPLDVLSHGTHLVTDSAFVNDHWELGSRVDVTLGLRHDRNNAHDADGTTVSNDRSWSPRFGLTVAVGPSERTRLNASFGRYTSKILEGPQTSNAAQQVGIFAVLGWRYMGPDINGPSVADAQLVSSADALTQLLAWFDSVGGVNNRQFISFVTYPGYSSTFQSPLASPSMDEKTIGVSNLIRSHGTIRTDIIIRDWHNFYAARIDRNTGTRTDPLGIVNDVAWIVNDDRETERRYRAIRIEGAWNTSGISAGASYTLSSLRGNDEAEELTTGQAPRNLPSSLWYPELTSYARRRPIGYLSQDQRHRARLWVAAMRRAGRGSMNVSLLQSFASGRAFSAVGDISVTAYAGAPGNLGYRLTQMTPQPYFFSARGAFRTDDVFSTDAAVQYEMPFESVRPFVYVAVTNGFNRSAVESVNTDVITLARQGAATGLAAFDPFNGKPVEGVHYRLGPLFGKAAGPSSYQPPRTFYVSAGVRF